MYVERSGPMQCCTCTDEPCHMHIAFFCHTLLVFPSLLRSQGHNPTVHCCAPVQWSRIWPSCCKHKGCPAVKQNRVGAVKSWSSYLIFPFLQSFFSVSDFICTPESRRKLIGVWVVFEEINARFHPHSLLWKLFKQRQNKWQCLDSLGIYSTKMKASLWGLIPNWSKASYLTTVGF